MVFNRTCSISKTIRMATAPPQIRSLLLRGSAYLNCINSIRSAATRQTYDAALKKFMLFLQIADVEDLLLLSDNPRLIESNIINFLVTYRQEPYNLSYRTLSVYLTAICYFYTINDVMLNRKKVGRYLGEEKPANRDRAYNTKEIQQVLTKCDERMRVVVLLLTSTGLRIGALPSLKLRNLMKIGTDSDEKRYVYQITVYEGTKEEYFCFCSPECVMAIESYLEYRGRLGEKLTPETQLIREQFDRNDLFRVRNPRKISLYTLLGVLTAVLVSSGVRTVVPDTADKDRGKRREVARAHGFRKFTTTNMIRARVNPEIREMLLGHSIGLSGSYYRPDSREMLQEYLRVVDLLTISDENRLRIKVDELTQSQDEIQLMRTKHEQDVKAIREDMENKFQQILAKIDIKKLKQ